MDPLDPVEDAVAAIWGIVNLFASWAEAAAAETLALSADAVSSIQTAMGAIGEAAGDSITAAQAGTMAAEDAQAATSLATYQTMNGLWSNAAVVGDTAAQQWLGETLVAAGRVDLVPEEILSTLASQSLPEAVVPDAMTAAQAGAGVDETLGASNVAAVDALQAGDTADGMSASLQSVMASAAGNPVATSAMESAGILTEDVAELVAAGVEDVEEGAVAEQTTFQAVRSAIASALSWLGPYGVMAVFVSVAAAIGWIKYGICLAINRIFHGKSYTAAKASCETSSCRAVQDMRAFFAKYQLYIYIAIAALVVFQVLMSRGEELFSTLFYGGVAAGIVMIINSFIGYVAQWTLCGLTQVL